MIVRAAVASTAAAITVVAVPSAAMATPDPGPRWGDLRALVLLERAADAARTTPYTGVQFVSDWGPTGTTSMLVDVDHLPGRGSVLRVRGTSGEPGGAVFTSDDDGSPSTASTASLALTGGAGGPLSLVARNFRVALAGRETVAGRPAHVVETRRATGEVAARFWLDDSAGVVLRREVYGQDGGLVRASSFVTVDIDDPVFVAHPPPMMPGPWSGVVGVSDLTGLRTAGWNCPDQLPGGLSLYDARRSGAAAGSTLHLSYSDGLSTVSVFEQPGRVDPARLEGYRSQQVDDAEVHVLDGVPRRVVWSAGGTVYTVIADAPPETADAVVRSLPHETPPHRGVAGRVLHGFARVASWVNPFG